MPTLAPAGIDNAVIVVVFGEYASWFAASVCVTPFTVIVKLVGVVAEAESTFSEKVTVTIPVLVFAEQLITVGGFVSGSVVVHVFVCPFATITFPALSCTFVTVTVIVATAGIDNPVIVVVFGEYEN